MTTADLGQVEPERETIVPEAAASDAKKSVSEALGAARRHNKLLIAFIGTLGAAIAPVTAYINKRYELDLKKAEQSHAHQLQVEIQQHTFQQDFLKDALSTDPKNGDLYHQRDVLEFFATVLEKDSRIQQYAQHKLDTTTQAVKLKAERDQALTDLKTKSDENVALLAKLRETSKSGHASQESIKALRARLSTKEAEVSQASAQTATLEGRVQELEKVVRAGVVERRDTCGPSRVLSTSHGDDPLILERCALLAPPVIGGKPWHIAYQGEDIICGCKAKPVDPKRQF